MAINITSPKSNAAYKDTATYITWAAVTGQTAYELCYRKKGATAWTSLGKTTSANNAVSIHTISAKSGITTFTDYDYKVIIYSTVHNTVTNGKGESVTGTLVSQEHSAAYKVVFIEEQAKGTLNAQISSTAKEEYGLYDDLGSRASTGQVNIAKDSSTILHAPLVNADSSLAGKVKVNDGTGTKHIAKTKPSWNSTDTSETAHGYHSQYVPQYYTYSYVNNYYYTNYYNTYTYKTPVEAVYSYNKYTKYQQTPATYGYTTYTSYYNVPATYSYKTYSYYTPNPAVYSYKLYYYASIKGYAYALYTRYTTDIAAYTYKKYTYANLQYSGYYSYAVYNKYTNPATYTYTVYRPQGSYYKSHLYYVKYNHQYTYTSYYYTAHPYSTYTNISYANYKATYSAYGTIQTYVIQQRLQSAYARGGYGILVFAFPSAYTRRTAAYNMCIAGYGISNAIAFPFVSPPSYGLKWNTYSYIYMTNTDVIAAYTKKYRAAYGTGPNATSYTIVPTRVITATYKVTSSYVSGYSYYHQLATKYHYIPAAKNNTAYNVKYYYGTYYSRYYYYNTYSYATINGYYYTKSTYSYKYYKPTYYYTTSTYTYAIPAYYKYNTFNYYYNYISGYNNNPAYYTYISTPAYNTHKVYSYHVVNTYNTYAAKYSYVYTKTYKYYTTSLYTYAYTARPAYYYTKIYNQGPNYTLHNLYGYNHINKSYSHIYYSK